MPKDTRNQGVQSDAEEPVETLSKPVAPELPELSEMKQGAEESETVPEVPTHSEAPDVPDPTNHVEVIASETTDLPDEVPEIPDRSTLQTPDQEHPHPRPSPVVTMLSSPLRMTILRTEEPLPREQPSETNPRSKTSDLPAEYARESLIKRHFEAKIAQYLDKIRLADSHALRFHQAWQQTKGQLRVSEKQRIESLKETARLKEQMESMQLSFQKQMDAMAEHVATLTLPTLRKSEEGA